MHKTDIWTHVPPTPHEIAAICLKDHSGNAMQAMHYCERITMAGYAEAAAILRELAGAEYVLQVQAELNQQGNL